MLQLFESNKQRRALEPTKIDHAKGEGIYK